jgi:hypothetical protein
MLKAINLSSFIKTYAKARAFSTSIQSLADDKSLIAKLLINGKHKDVYTFFNENSIEFKLLKKNEAKPIELKKQFPYIWLRDSCKCKECYDPGADEKRNDLNKTELDIAPKSIRLLENVENIKENFEITCMSTA